MKPHKVVSRAEWIEARKAHMAHEKEFTRARDRLAEERRALPWVKIDKDYAFDGPNGRAGLADLFKGRPQLVVQHFMFAPDWDAGCKSCSFWADNFERNVIHLAHRDATMVAISRAPIEKLLAYQKRFGWTFKWVSSGRSDFNFDYRVSFEAGKAGQTYNFAPTTTEMSDLPGISVFYRDADGSIYRTYSTYARGIEVVNAAYQCLDLLPKGRDEGQGPMSWLRRRDEYDVPA